MGPRRVAALVLGSLLALPAIGLVIGGGALALAYAIGRDDDGFFEVSIDRLESSTVAITAKELDVTADPGSPDRLFDVLDVDVRLRVTGADTTSEVFIGIARASDVDAYLAGVAHREVRAIDEDGEPTYRQHAGSIEVAAPTGEAFWAVSTTGPGTQEIDWDATAGGWAVVFMNADGSPGVAVDTDVGVRAGFLVPLMIMLLSVGTLLAVGALSLIITGATSTVERAMGPSPHGTGAAKPVPAGPVDTPVTLEAHLDPDLSRWRWLVKWFLALPHVLALFFLWIVFFVLTILAAINIVFTERYPRNIFDFNVGVLRWSWRVSYYASSGGIGTDRYPPFTLANDPTYPASFDVAYPERLSRWLVLVKWWLLAIPHYAVVAVLAGGSIGWAFGYSDGLRFDAASGGGFLGIVVLIAAVVLLVTGRYPRPLFELIVGLNRWIYRVAAYSALMTDRYPPFRLDQGGTEPGRSAPDSAPPQSTSSAAVADEPAGV